MILEQDAKRAIVWGRSEEEWRASIVSRGQLTLPGTELVLDLDRLYAPLGL